MGKQGSLEVVDFEDSVAQFQSCNIDGFNFCLIKYAERLSLSLSLSLSLLSLAGIVPNTTS